MQNKFIWIWIIKSSRFVGYFRMGNLDSSYIPFIKQLLPLTHLINRYKCEGIGQIYKKDKFSSFHLYKFISKISQSVTYSVKYD